MPKAKSSGLGIDDVIGDKRQAVLELAEKHGARNIRVFGSVARGEAGPDSDIDLLVEWDMARISAWGGRAAGYRTATPIRSSCGHHD